MDNNILLYLGLGTPAILSIVLLIIGLLNDRIASVTLCISFFVCVQFINIFITSLFRSKSNIANIQNSLSTKDCGLFQKATAVFTNETLILPSSILMTSYMLTFFVASMIVSMNTNMSLVLGLLLLSINHIYQYNENKCNEKGIIIISIFIGVIIGCIPFILKTIDSSLLLFGKRDSNNTQCSKVSKKKFKCSVYKNGELIS